MTTQPMAYSTRRRHMRELRRLIETSDDVMTSRIAYAMECAVRRVTEPYAGWPSLAEEAEINARLLRNELAKR